MRRTVVALAALMLLAGACTAGGGTGQSPPPTVNPSATHEPVTIEIWGAWSGRELKQFNQIFPAFEEKYPWITVKSVGNRDDEAIVAAIRVGRELSSGVVVAILPDSGVKYLSTQLWQ